MKSHVEKHIHGYLHPCQQCTETFNTRKRLRYHMARSHTATGINAISDLDEEILQLTVKTASGKWQCKTCNYLTNHKPHLKDHIECRHIIGYSHPCKVCSKIFLNRKSLRVHKSCVHSKSKETHYLVKTETEMHK